MSKPYALIDVDGVLNPEFKCKPPYCKCHRAWRKRNVQPGGVNYKLIVNPAHGPALLRLAADTGAELAWGTSWADYANEWIAPLVGLPSLPYVPVPPRPHWDPHTDLDAARTNGAWKVLHALPFIGDREFVWFDDEPEVDLALDWAASVQDVPAHLVVLVDERTGLTDDNLAQAREWLLARAVACSS